VRGTLHLHGHPAAAALADAAAAGPAHDDTGVPAGRQESEGPGPADRALGAGEQLAGRVESEGAADPAVFVLEVSHEDGDCARLEPGQRGPGAGERVGAGLVGEPRQAAVEAVGEVGPGRLLGLVLGEEDGGDWLFVEDAHGGVELVGGDLVPVRLGDVSGLLGVLARG